MSFSKSLQLKCCCNCSPALHSIAQHSRAQAVHSTNVAFYLSFAVDSCFQNTFYLQFSTEIRFFKNSYNREKNFVFLFEYYNQIISQRLTVVPIVSVAQSLSVLFRAQPTIELNDLLCN